MAKTDDKEKKESPFEAMIRAFLEKRAAEDELFARTYAKPNKNIPECCKYIAGEMRKKAVAGMAICCGMDDQLGESEVMQLAIHYYDEDDIKVEKVGKYTVSASGNTAPIKPAEPPKPKVVQLTFDF